ncbi:MAG: c-type cytochrome biogenesis protein CcmI [Alphaproteobacteria bacterium]|nr:c-type cytochrome biogenesis protein CcmI [Alphaproteobacteria bacterium]
MLLWILFSVVTAGAIAFAAEPFLRKARAPVVGPSRRDIYARQIAELEAELSAGRLSAEEAAMGRAEIGRRLLALPPQEAPQPQAAGQGVGPAMPMAAVALAVLVTAVALVSYLKLGSPSLEGQPLAARGEEIARQRQYEDLVAAVEQKLAQNPNDSYGWELLAGAYRRLGRIEDAAAAYGRAAETQGPGGAPAPLWSEQGEVLTMLMDGAVSRPAKQAFEKALAADPKDPRARYYLALERAQKGDREAAITGWEALLADAPPDAPFRPMIEEQIAIAKGAAPIPDAPASP